MNIRYKSVGKFVIYTSAFFCFLFMVGLTQAQSRKLTKNEMDMLNTALKKAEIDGDAMLKKAPTPEQDAQFSRISEKHQSKYAEGVFLNSKSLGSEIDKILAAKDCPLTRSHIQAAIRIHKNLRSLYAEHFTQISEWGNKSGRISCVRQAGKMSAYMNKLSDQWLAKTLALPLATVADRAYAAYWIGAGLNGFSPGGDPLADPKHAVGFEIIGLYGVCRGNNEYEPGTE